MIRFLDRELRLDSLLRRSIPGRAGAARYAPAMPDLDQLLQHRGSLGSRLHRGPDDVWYGYAQWPSAEARATAFADPIASGARERMREAIEESLPDIELDPVSDYLVLPPERES